MSKPRPTLTAFIEANTLAGTGVHTCDMWARYTHLNGFLKIGRNNFTQALAEDMAAMGHVESRAIRLGRTTKRGYVGIRLCSV